MGLGLSEGLGSALPNGPGLEPALLLAHCLCFNGLPAMGCASLHGACLLHSFRCMPAAAQGGESSALLLREPTLPTFPGWRATTASRSAPLLLAWCIGLVLSPRQRERRIFMPSRSMSAGLRRLAVSKTAPMNHTASTALPNVRVEAGPTASHQARAGENVPRTTGPGLVACRWASPRTRG